MRSNLFGGDELRGSRVDDAKHAMSTNARLLSVHVDEASFPSTETQLKTSFLSRLGTSRSLLYTQYLLAVAAISLFIMMYKSFVFAASALGVSAAAVDRREGSTASPTSSAAHNSTSTVPQYFQTTPELYPGMLL